MQNVTAALGWQISPPVVDTPRFPGANEQKLRRASAPRSSCSKWHSQNVYILRQKDGGLIIRFYQGKLGSSYDGS